MKNIVVIVVAVVAVAALAFGVVNFVRADQAQAAFPGQTWGQDFSGMMGNGHSANGGRMMDNQQFGRGNEMMGNQQFGRDRGMMGNGQFSGNAAGMNVMHTYMQDALAEKLGMTSDELSASLTDGKSLLDLAAEKGLTVAEFQTLRDEAHVAAIDKALADGAISQDQADWMKENQPGMHNGFGCR